MLIRITLILFWLGGMLYAADRETDPASTLARILAAKGTISQAELATVESTAADRRVAELASVLERKGLLTQAEVAQLWPGRDRSNPAPPSAAAVLAQSPQARPAPAAVTAAAPPATSEKHVPLTFYGTLLTNAVYDTAGTNIEDIPLFVTKQGSDASGGDKSFAMTARQTRLGLRFEQPDVAGSRLIGQFEFDLLGGQTAYGNGIAMDLFRLREAYGRMEWKHFALEAGQDWSIFAPLNPTSLAQYAIPEFAASGNPWIRLPQFRTEFTTTVHGSNRLLWQFDAADPDMGDYPTATFSASRQPAVGERGRMPSLESRIAWTRRFDDRDFTIAMSGHYGRGRNFGTIDGRNVQTAVDSWGVALDYSLPVTRLFHLTGEVFAGRALGIYSVAAGEAVGAPGTPGEHGVESRGGWAQAKFDFTKRWQMNLAYGLEVPNASQLPAGNRWRNQTYMGNLMYKLNPHVIFAWEYRRLLTDYRNQAAANERGDNVNMAVGYMF